MSRRMLINAQKDEELRVAVVDGNTLENYQVEVADQGLSRGNIYRGRIVSVQPSLNAAFIDYGADRHGFLAIQDVCEAAYYRQPKGSGRPRIEDVLEKGKPIVVQVVKEAEGTKGAALTTNLSLAGRYLVLTPFDDTVGVSRKVEDDDTRRRLKEQAKKLEAPEGCGVIVRTNALDQNKADLQRDLSALLRLWKRIADQARQGDGIQLLYSDQDLILRALRDYLDREISEILIDDDEALEKAREYMRAFMPRGRIEVKRYSERTPLFSAYGLEPQIDRIYERSVGLPSGGSLVIDRTEALVAIDVNSGRSTKASTQEETAVSTNLEAAREVARQLRLRDIGGLMVVDFIDMRSRKNQRKVEKALRDEMKADRARSTVGRISSNGLLEINRQKIQQALSLRTHRPCPTCGGTGRIASPEMVGLNLLRRIEARAVSGAIDGVKIALHPELADAFQNGRRDQIHRLEADFGIQVKVIASARLHRSEQEVEWIEREASAEPARESRRTSTADSASSPPRRRSRRGSRRSPSRRSRGADTGDGGGKSAAGEGGGDGDAEKNGDSGSGRPRRRRRRRRRKPAEGRPTS